MNQSPIENAAVSAALSRLNRLEEYVRADNNNLTLLTDAFETALRCSEFDRAHLHGGHGRERITLRATGGQVLHADLVGMLLDHLHVVECRGRHLQLLDQLFSSQRRHLALRRAALPMGSTVLITGASGGVGIHAVRLAALAGHRVIAATSSAAKAAQLRDAGMQVHPFDAAAFSKALTRRATLAREWLLFLEKYAVLVMPVSGELPFPDHLDRKDEASFARVWKAQLPQIAM